jgi:hypothetical protein
MKSIATSTIAAAVLSFDGKVVVKHDMIRRASDWMANPASKRPRRPNLSTVKVLTNTISSWRTD